jgi:hypothetical protein
VNYLSNAIEIVDAGRSTESHDADDNNHMDVDGDDNPIDLVDESTPSAEIRGQIKELPGVQIVAKPRAKHYQNSVCCHRDLFIVRKSHS